MIERITGMSYKYETHMHTSEGSACGKFTGAEMARAYKEAGYTGIFVTDHFFNGSCAVDSRLLWEEKVELFCRGYENAKAEGDRIGLDVFFGFEYGVEGADFLIYNLDKEWLLKHKDVDKWEPRMAFRAMHRAGGFIVHAHPFRERDYINHIHLFPRDVDGVEVINGGQLSEPWMNERAEIYAMMYELPKTSGSDAHHADSLRECGIQVERRFKTPLDYLEQLKTGEMTLLQGKVK